MYCSTKNDIISAFDDAGRPLDAETKSDLDETEEILRHSGVNLEFAVFPGKCRICNDEQGIIAPVIADLDNLECINCGNMTVQEKEDLEWE